MISPLRHKLSLTFSSWLEYYPWSIQLSVNPEWKIIFCGTFQKPLRCWENHGRDNIERWTKIWLFTFCCPMSCRPWWVNKTGSLLGLRTTGLGFSLSTFNVLFHCISLHLFTPASSIMVRFEVRCLWFHKILWILYDSSIYRWYDSVYNLSYPWIYIKHLIAWFRCLTKLNE